MSYRPSCNSKSSHILSFCFKAYIFWTKISSIRTEGHLNFEPFALICYAVFSRMESSEPTPSAEELELKEFNDPFDVVSDNYIRQRRAEIDFEPISQEDDEKLAHMLDSMPIEDSLIHDAFSRMISMNLVSAEIANQVQEDFDFEKVRFISLSGFIARLLPCIPS